jgi:hypothetical protein
LEFAILISSPSPFLPYLVSAINFSTSPIGILSLLWLCLIVVGLAVTYVVIIGRKYTDYVQETQPYIEEAIERNEKLTKAISAEKEVNRNVIEEVKTVELAINDLKIGVAKVEDEIRKEADLLEKLELSKQMKQFNKKKA